MNPSLTSVNHAYVGIADPELLGHYRPCNPRVKKFAHSQDLCFSQDSHRVLPPSAYLFGVQTHSVSFPSRYALRMGTTSMTFPSSLTALLYFIRNVVCLRTEEQMQRVGARWVVASMQHALAVWYGANMHLIRSTVGRILSVLISELPISKRYSSSKPTPAFIRRSTFLNQAHKFIAQRRILGDRVALKEPTIAAPSIGVFQGGLGQYSTTPTLTELGRRLVEIKRQLLYLIHVNSPDMRIGRTPDVSASRGLIVPTLYHSQAVYA